MGGFAAAPVSAMAGVERFVVDAAHTQLAFGYDHLGYRANYGMFGGFEGEIMLHEAPSAFRRSRSRRRP